MTDDKVFSVDHSIIVEQRIEPGVIRQEESMQWLRKRLEVMDERVSLLQERLETMHSLDRTTAQMLGSAWRQNADLRAVVQTLVSGPPGRLTLVAGNHALDWFENLMADARKALGSASPKEDAA